MPRVYYDSEEEAERELDAYLKHYQGTDSAAGIIYDYEGLYVEYNHPWPLPTRNDG